MPKHPSMAFTFRKAKALHPKEWGKHKDWRLCVSCGCFLLSILIPGTLQLGHGCLMWINHLATNQNKASEPHLTSEPTPTKNEALQILLSHIFISNHYSYTSSDVNCTQSQNMTKQHCKNTPTDLAGESALTNLKQHKLFPHWAMEKQGQACRLFRPPESLCLVHLGFWKPLAWHYL